ncbi:MAG: sulfatase-like hydrolase/transferase [Oscillospiraceae bacterium]|nr:sulfatase-like hydrolase/transferase [Oscillospiraceae bacterium]
MKNIIFILTDDQGYGDLSCMGSTDFVTPHLDALAAAGARFTSGYSNSPVCSPSRAALLTGRYPGNAGVRAILEGHRKASGLTPQAKTIATHLRERGYVTGLMGKWHLGAKEICRPENNGFDEFVGFHAGCVDYFSHIFYHHMADRGRNPEHDLWDREEEINENGKYLTELITEKSVAFIRDKALKSKPFFLFAAYNAPHYPMHAPKKYMDRFAHLPWDRQVMAAMISAVDDGVGEMVAELKRQGLFENTIIYFQSDNGPSRETRNWLDGTQDYYCGGRTGGFKGEKFSLFEGGIRVPAILTCPSLIPAGQVIDEPIAAMDLFPTVCAMAGLDTDGCTLDGLDISDVAINGAPSPHKHIFWEMGKQTAVRSGDYKLVLHGQLLETEPAPDEIWLSNLREDPGETRNVAEEMPELTATLKTAAEEWRAGIENAWETTWRFNYENTTK